MCDRQPRRRPSLQRLIRRRHRQTHRLFPKTTTAIPISIDVSFLFFLAALSLLCFRTFTPLGEFKYVTSVHSGMLRSLSPFATLCTRIIPRLLSDVQMKLLNRTLFISLESLYLSHYSWIARSFVLFTDQFSTPSLARLWVCSNERTSATSPLPQSSR